MTEQIFQVGLYLGLIVALIVLLGFVAKRLNPQTMIASNSGMRVVSTLSLGLKEKLVMVQVGEQQLLLGVTPGSIAKIEGFEEPIINLRSEGAKDFKTKLQEVMKSNANVES